MEKGRILIVDDDSDIRSVLNDALSDRGYTTATAPDGGRGLAALEEGAFDLLLSDLAMPVLNGIELMRAACRHDPEIEVIILTGHADFETAIEALRLGATDYLTKPLDSLVVLYHAVERALERRRLRKANRDLIVELRAAKQRLEHQRVAELERIEQIGRALASNMQREQIVELLQQALLVNEEYCCEAVALLTWNDKGEYGTISTRSKHPIPGAASAALCDRMRELAIAVGGPVNQPRGLEINQLPDEQLREAEPLFKPLKCEDSESLLVQGRPLGVLAAFAMGSQSLSLECHRVFHILAGQAATALDSIALYEQIQELARRDGLTGLYNHTYFAELMDMEVRRSRRYKRAVALLFIDVDHFKQVNDSFGHPAGDQVLRELADFIQTSVRDTDIVGRYGGEEFVVLLPESSEREAVGLAERLRLGIEGHPFEAGGHRVYLTVSVGVAAFRGEQVGTGEELLWAADNALLAAKGGRNRVCLYRSAGSMG